MSHFALPHLIVDRSEARGDDIALVSVEEGPLSWLEFERLSRRWAGALERLGVGKSDTVVTMVPNSPTAVSVWAGCSWLRAIEVPVNTEYRGEWLVHAIGNAKAKVAVIAAEILPHLINVEASLPELETIVVVGGVPEVESSKYLVQDGEVLSGPLQGLPDSCRDDISCIIYTSGTTGRSKGVMMPWSQLEFAVQSGILPKEERKPDDIYYMPFAPYHVTGKGPVYGSALMHGTTVVTRRRFSVGDFWKDVRTYNCTETLIVGAMAQFLVGLPPRPEDTDNPLRRAVMAPVIPDVEGFMKRFGIDIYTGYSMTELSVPFLTSPERASTEKLGTCGRLRPGYRVRLVGQDGKEVPVNSAGELWVRTDDPGAMMSGYFNMEEETRALMEDGWFRTGDLMKRDEDGYYYFVDRKKDYIRRRGENISSFEVEAAVNKHPDVHESAAVGVVSEFSEDEVKVAVVPIPGKEIDPGELYEFLTGIMPRFALPRYIEVLPELPKTPTARIQKAVIRDAGVTPATWDHERF